MKNLLTGIACACLLAGALAAHADEAGIRTLAQGPRSGVDKPEQAVVRSQADWEKLWSRHLSRQVGGTPQPPPKVDWSKEMVLAAFLGTRSTGGYKVEITAAQPQNGKLRVTVTEFTPAPGTLRSQSITYPFHFAAVPRSELPVEWKVTATPAKASG